jgi:acyl-CoA reductase-like NAD-dependent aldehyde dehydrogenase
VENIKAEVVGDPMNSKTTVGPLVRQNQRDALSKQVEDAKTKGAIILIGGKEIEGNGYFYEPTIVSKVNHEMDIVKDEVFGPAAPIMQDIFRVALYR